MRLLLLDHEFAPQTAESAAGLDLAAELQRQGHTVRMLVVTSLPVAPTPEMSVLVCTATDSTADLRLRCPRLVPREADEQRFGDLTASDAAAYRELLRRSLDEEIARFDPHCCHALQMWIFGQLALESGVPYIVSVAGPELETCRTDLLFGPLAEQAAENAGAVLVPSAELGHGVAAQFPHVEAARIQVLPALYESLPSAAVAELVQHYTAAWQQRAGGHR